jgi:hypothetical protein
MKKQTREIKIAGREEMLEVITENAETKDKDIQTIRR